MLTIRKEQMQVFELATMSRFEDEMVVHSQKYAPKLCKVLGEEQLRVAVRQAIGRASRYGFTYRGPIRLFIELMFLFGSAFDTDPQYPMLGAVLNAPNDQMQRAEQIHTKVVDYLQKVSGTNDANVQKALKALAAFARNPITFSSNDIVAGMLQAMTRAFPQKVAYIGNEALTTLIHEGRSEAQKYAFDTVRGEVLVIVLMYAFGHGCTDDPLYPWISRTLRNEKIINPASRAERLESKAMTWLDHVLAGYSEGAQP
jgi:hypothetical protein